MGNANTKKVHAQPAQGSTAPATSTAGGGATTAATAGSAQAAATIPWYLAVLVVVAVVAVAVGVGVGLTLGKPSENSTFSANATSPSPSPSTVSLVVGSVSPSPSPSSSGAGVTAAATPSYTASTTTTRIGTAGATPSATLTKTATFTQTALPDPFYTVRTLAGDGRSNWADGIGTAASIAFPMDLVYHPSGLLYVGDKGNQMIRVINCTDRSVTTLVGDGNPDTADGFGTAAHIYWPMGLALSPSGDILYASATGSHRIRAVDLATTEVTTIAGSTDGLVDGIGTNAKFYYPLGITYYSGNLFIMDTSNSVIRKLVIATNDVTTFAGSTPGFQDGIGTNAKFFSVSYGAADGQGNLWVTDASNNAIRKITIATGQVDTIAGGGTTPLADGIGTNAAFGNPNGIAIDNAGNIFIAETDGQRVRFLNRTTYEVTSLVGQAENIGSTDGTGTNALLDDPGNIAVDNKGLLYIADTNSDKIRYFRYY